MITKQTFLQFNQCPKYMWYEGQKSNKIIKRLDSNRLYPYVKKLFPESISVPNLPGQYYKMAQITKQYLNENHSIIYNPCFVKEDIFVQYDFMVVKNNTYHVYDVKASTKLSKRFLLELSFNKHIMEKQLKMPVKSYLIYVNKNYLRTGKIKAEKLLLIQPVDRDLINIKPSIVLKMRNTLLLDLPHIDIGLHCESSAEFIECPYKADCYKADENSIFELAGLHKSELYELFHNGIQQMHMIEDSRAYGKNQRIQIECLKRNIAIVDHKMIRDYLKIFKLPLYFLDFESFRDILPPFNRTSPYTEIPFQYSIHILNETLTQKGFLGKPGEDPRRALAEQLIHDIPENVQIIAYNMSYEKRVIKNLANLFVDLSKDLMIRHDHIYDLEVPFEKKWYYLNDMKGKYSIKNVLPALFPMDKNLDYNTLTIQNGLMAMTTYRDLNRNPDAVNKETLKDLWDYCSLDTLAMVKIYQKLKEDIR
ncbi:MAG: DUF2779 domain-containing protein [Clostridia bacterium]|nr:DUF2779 domain-containing protein [Clostridia bacterium]